ncbi:hypothetical protein KQQSB11_480061 [Klebsiella quasipneumoniae subsp. quasipneumoniae]|nr:hypothetical protein KQQSB11_480061 [Klebsiella quasipneumoniae subsp. quasipneumoniae]
MGAFSPRFPQVKKDKMKVIASQDDEEIAGRQPSCSGLDHSATCQPSPGWATPGASE